jgi:phenylpropionate dioxygenase-like ring-hydroxylating dioxygenase large terminal subunit
VTDTVREGEGLASQETAPPAYLFETGDDPWLPVGDGRIDVDDYVSRRFHEREASGLWNRVWQFGCRANEIPEVGDYFEYEIVGQSVVIVRNGPHTVSAFRNSCRHRARAVAEGRGNVSCFVCPFHGWTYSLDGALIRRPANRDFAEFPRAEFSLFPVRAEEFDGYVFVNLDPNADSLIEFLGEDLVRHLSVFPDAGKRQVWSLGITVPCNWKVMMDAFMETYHIPVTHNTVGDPRLETMLTPSSPFGLHARLFGLAGKDARGTYSAEEMAERLGISAASATSEDPPTSPALNALTTLSQMGEAVESVRIPSDLKKFDVEDVLQFNSVAREYWASRGLDLSDVSDLAIIPSGTGVYTIFPNIMVFRGATTNLIYRFRPDGENHRSCLFDMSLLEAVPPGFKRLRDASLTMLTPGEKFSDREPKEFGAIVDQDVANCPKVQKGLESRAYSNDPQAAHIVTGQMQEYTVAGFHRNIHAWLDQHSGLD